jgi:hypothetical protein
MDAKSINGQLLTQIDAISYYLSSCEPPVLKKINKNKIKNTRNQTSEHAGVWSVIIPKFINLW